MFSYSGRVKSPEWRWQQKRADLRHFEIFRHGPIIIYTRLPAGVIYYPICTFPASSECLIGISDAFSAFCLRVSVILPTCSVYPQQKHAYSALHPQAWTYIYKSMPEGSYRVQYPGFPKIVYWANFCFANLVWSIRRTATKLYSGSRKLRSACSGNIRPIRRTLPLIG